MKSDAPIILLSEIYPPAIGGSGCYLSNLVERTQFSDWRVMASGKGRTGKHDLSYPLTIERLRLSFKDWGFITPNNMKDYGYAIRRVRESCEQHHITKMLCARAVPEGWMARKLKNKGYGDYALFVHGEELNTYGTSRQLTYMARRVYRDASFIICNSQNTKEELLKTGWRKDENIEIIHPGCDTDHFKPSADLSELKDDLGWTGHQVVLTTGRLVPRKGADQLIRAISMLSESYPDLRLVIVGDGPMRSDLETLIIAQEMQDRVTLAGEIEHESLLKHYQACDLFVLANRVVDGDFEGFGIVLVEAQSCGKPVICGVSGGPKETMSEGITGYLVDPEHPHELSKTIKQVLYDEETEKMGSAAREWAKWHYDWKELAAQLDQVLLKYGWTQEEGVKS